MFSFKSLGHVIATFFKAVGKEAPVVIDTIEKSKPVLDIVLPLVPGLGQVAKTVADLGFACLGELGSVIHVAGAAGKAKLMDAGLDLNVLQAVEALIKQFGGLEAFVSALSCKAPIAPAPAA